MRRKRCSHLWPFSPARCESLHSTTSHPCSYPVSNKSHLLYTLTPFCSAFFAAAHFTILTKVCLLYGEKLLWPVRSSWLIPCFVILDVASLAVQGGGSGQAATAEINGEDVSSVNSKGNIVVAGLAIQLLVSATASYCYVLQRYHSRDIYYSTACSSW